MFEEKIPQIKANEMKVPMLFISLAATAILALQSWQLLAIVDLKANVSALTAVVQILEKNNEK